MIINWKQWQCADSEQKMIQSISKGQVVSEVQLEPEPNNSEAPLYMNNLDPIHAEENMIEEKIR